MYSLVWRSSDRANLYKAAPCSPNNSSKELVALSGFNFLFALSPEKSSNCFLAHNSMNCLRKKSEDSSGMGSLNLSQYLTINSIPQFL